MLIFETVLIKSFSCFWACLFSKILESCLFSKRCLLSHEYGSKIVYHVQNFSWRHGVNGLVFIAHCSLSSTSLLSKMALK